MTRLRTTSLPAISVIVVMAACSFAAQRTLGQTTSVYLPTNNTSGTWHNVARWDNGIIPNAIDAAAVLNQPVSTTQTSGTYALTLDGIPTTIGSLTSNNAAQDFRTQINNGSLIFQTSSGPATLNENLGTSTVLESRLRINVPVTLLSDLVVNQNHNLARNTSTEFVQRIDADASKTLTKEGFGNLQFAYAGPLGESEGFFGHLIINNGGVRLIVPNNQPENVENTVFSKAAGVTVMAGGQLQFGNHITTVNLGPGAELKLNGTGKVPPAATAQNDGALRFENNAGFEIVCTFNNPVNLQSASHINVAAIDCTGVLTEEVRGVGTLIKTGDGLLVLNAPNVYSGGTTVMNGALAVNNTTGSGVGDGDVTVLGGTLGGAGILGTETDAVNVTLTGGTLAPGALTATILANSPTGLFTSPGVLTVNGDVTFDSASTLHIDITGGDVGAQYDQLVATGGISLGGATLNLNLDGFVPTGSESFTIISNVGSGAVIGEFGNYAQGAAVDLAGLTYYINYMGGNGNDVVLSPAPPAIADADFDQDGDVDGADFLIWQRGVGGSGGLSQGDANGDALVDSADLVVWKNQFGDGNEAGVAAIPEPASTTLLCLAASLCLLRARATRKPAAPAIG